MEILKEIDVLLAKQNMSKDDLVLTWCLEGLVNFGVLRSKYLSRALSYRPITEMSKVKPGVFYHKDGNLSTDYIGDDVLAMVVSVNAKEKTAVALLLESEILPFSSDMYVFDTVGLSGKEATEKICHEAALLGIKAEAAQYCHSFSCDGVAAGDAFLFSEREAADVVAYMFNIKAACDAAKMHSWRIWTSTSYDTFVGKCCIFGGAYIGEETLDISLPVHPAIQLDLRKIL